MKTLQNENIIVVRGDMIGEIDNRNREEISILVTEDQGVVVAKKEDKGQWSSYEKVPNLKTNNYDLTMNKQGADQLGLTGNVNIKDNEENTNTPNPDTENNNEKDEEDDKKENGIISNISLGSIGLLFLSSLLA